MNPLLRPAPGEALRRLSDSLAAVRAEIESACARAGRPPGSVELLPVVKHVDAATVRLLHQAGVRDAAESTVQEAAGKRSALSDLAGLRWHLVGHLQTNKARKAVGMFASLHSLDSVKLARKLEDELAAAEEGGAPPLSLLPRIYLEVNIAREERKTGVLPEALATVIAGLGGFPRVAARLAGLMAMAPHSEDPEAARPHFRRLRELRDGLAGAGVLPPGAGLSMGMSGDFPVAVEEGSTVVRVGARLFERLSAPAGEVPPCR